MGEHPGPVGDRGNLVSLHLQGTGERLARGTVILGQQDTLLHGSNTSGRGWGRHDRRLGHRVFLIHAELRSSIMRDLGERTVRSHQELSESREDVSR
jgi:hypothetical protein